MSGLNIESAMTRSVVTFAPATSVREIVENMLSKHIGAVVVVEGEKPVGIFSERDLMNGLISSVDNILDKPVSAVMTPNPVTVAPGAGFAQVMDLMDSRAIRHVPVVEGDKLIGILSIKDMLRVQVNAIRERVQAMSEPKPPPAA